MAGPSQRHHHQRTVTVRAFQFKLNSLMETLNHAQSINQSINQVKLLLYRIVRISICCSLLGD